MLANNRFLILALLLLMFSGLNGQIKTRGFAIGIAGGASIGDMDGTRDDEPGAFQVNGFFRHPILGPFEGQIGGSALGEFKGNPNNFYTTRFITADYRLLLRLISTNPFSLYGYGGIGALNYEVIDAPLNPSPEAENQAWVPFAPVGAGFQIGFGKIVSLDVSGGYNFAFSDDLNLIARGSNDGFFSAMAGLTFTRGGGPPKPVDTDGDGVDDSEENEIGTRIDMVDTDGDGLSDGDELRKHRTHPLKADTDGDGLSDYTEIITIGSNPRMMDTDEDGLDDGQEVNQYKTDPLRKDTDGDRISDSDEVRISKTDPTDADMDGDGIDDGQEVATHRTDPQNPDSDGDGLSDKDELYTHKTNPLEFDTDGGTVGDGEEVERGSNPLNAEDDVTLDVAEVGAKIVLEGIVFASGKANITPESASILQKALNTLSAYPEMEVEIRGYTDNVGRRSLNQQLSQRRAEAVRTFLVQSGVDPGRIIARGYGPANPIAPNSTREGRAQNRRIEFVRLK